MQNSPSPTPSSSTTPKPNYLANTMAKALDSILSLASSKSPINLDPIQMAYDLSSRVIKKCGEIIEPVSNVVEKTRSSILGIFGLK